MKQLARNPCKIPYPAEPARLIGLAGSRPAGLDVRPAARPEPGKPATALDLDPLN